MDKRILCMLLPFLAAVCSAQAAVDWWAVPAMSGVPRMADSFPKDGKKGGALRVVAARGEFESCSLARTTVRRIPNTCAGVTWGGETTWQISRWGRWEFADMTDALKTAIKRSLLRGAVERFRARRRTRRVRRTDRWERS